MRPRVVAASAATLIAAASMSPIAAQAAGQNAIYVNSGNSACSDSGPGTFSAPLCSIQAAADAANPGDVVMISTGTYVSGAVITRSGTASAPIIFTGGPQRATIGNGSTASSELTISGASNIEIENLAIYSGTSASVTVNGGSNDTIASDRLISASTSSGATAVHVTGGASGVTVRDSLAINGIVVDGGSTGTFVTTNAVNAARSTPISVQGATNTAVTSNTVYGCGPEVSVSGSSTGTSIENNVVSAPGGAGCPTANAPYGIQVDATSAGSTTLDYNDVYAGTAGNPYSWNGTSYATASALYTGVKQGQHEYNGSDGGSVGENSPLINSANSAAIGEESTDIYGNPRTLDPLVTPTGAGPYNYYDRGAYQFQDPYTATASSFLTVSQTKVPLGTTITAKAALADTWGDTFGSYKFEFGSATPIISSTPTVTYTPTTTGVFNAYVLGAASSGSTYHSLNGVYGQNVSVVTPQPLVPKENLSQNGELGVLANNLGTTDAWNVSSVTYDFGDSTQTQTVADGVQVSHTYTKSGTYPITETVTDAAGNTATTTSTFTTAAPVAGTLVGVQLAGGVPANTTGIAQAAISGVNTSEGEEVLAATTSGQAEFSTADANGNWQPWQVFSQPGVTVKWVGIAGMPNNSSQLIEVTSTGSLLHTIRNADGTWQSSGWGTPAGSTGFVHASITAMPDGSTQLVAVTTAGVLMHNIRHANGSWQGWRPLNQPGVNIIDASIAGMPDGSSQIVEVTSAHVLKHDIRFANGSWQKSGWGSPAGSTGIAQVSIAAEPGGNLQIAATETDGAAEQNTRYGNGSWYGWQQIDLTPTHSISNISAGYVPYQLYIADMIAVSGG